MDGFLNILDNIASQQRAFKVQTRKKLLLKCCCNLKQGSANFREEFGGIQIALWSFLPSRLVRLAGAGYNDKYQILILCLCCLKVPARKVIFYKFFFVQKAKVAEWGCLIILFPVSPDLPCSIQWDDPQVKFVAATLSWNNLQDIHISFYFDWNWHFYIDEYFSSMYNSIILIIPLKSQSKSGEGVWCQENVLWLLTKWSKLCW